MNPRENVTMNWHRWPACFFSTFKYPLPVCLCGAILNTWNLGAPRPPPNTECQLILSNSRDSRQESDPPTTFHFSSPGLHPTTQKTGARAAPYSQPLRETKGLKTACREQERHTQAAPPLQFLSSSEMPTCRCQIRTSEGVDRALVSAPGNQNISIRLQSTHRGCPKACWAPSLAVYYYHQAGSHCLQKDGWHSAFFLPALKSFS